MIPSNDNEPVLINMTDTCAMTSMSRAMIDIYRKRGDFPIAVPLGEKRIAFLRSEVSEFIQSRIDARKAA